MTPAEPFLIAAPAFSRAWIWALADRPTPYLRSGLALQEVQSCDQLFVGDATANRRGDKAVKARERVTADVAVIESKSKLVDVAPKVLGAGMVIYPMQTTFEHGPNALNAVSRHPVAAVLSRAVVDGCVLKKQPADTAIRCGLISVQRRSGLNVRMDRRVQIGRVRAGYRLGNRATAPLTHTHHRCLSDGATARIKLFVGVFGRLFTADVNLVNLDDATQHRRIVAARLSETLQDKPRRFLRHADLFGELQRRYAFARGDKQINRVEPLVQRHMRPLKNRSGAHSKVLFALVAAVVSALARRDALRQAANRASCARWPQSGLKVHPSAFGIREKLEKLQRADGDFVAHLLSDPINTPPRHWDVLHDFGRCHEVAACGVTGQGCVLRHCAGCSGRGRIGIDAALCALPDHLAARGHVHDVASAALADSDERAHGYRPAICRAAAFEAGLIPT